MSDEIPGLRPALRRAERAAAVAGSLLDQVPDSIDRMFLGHLAAAHHVSVAETTQRPVEEWRHWHDSETHTTHKHG